MQVEIEDAERKLFAKIFGWKVGQLRRATVMPDRFLVPEGHPLSAEHQRISLIETEMGERFIHKLDRDLSGPIASLSSVAAADALPADMLGATAVAGIQRLLWITENPHDFGPPRRACDANFMPLLVLVRRWLSHSSVFPQELLAGAIDEGRRAKSQNVLHVFGALVNALERAAEKRPLEPVLRAALAAMAAWIDKAAEDLFRYDGRRNCVIDGVRLGKLSDRFKLLASGATVQPVAAAPPRRPWLDLSKVPVVKAKPSKPARAKTTTKAKTLKSRPLEEGRDLAEAIFGAKTVEKLQLRELTIDGVVLLESRSLTPSVAGKYLAQPTPKGVSLALSTYAVDERRPKAEMVRRAVAAQSDDGAYRKWLSGRLEEAGDRISALTTELEAVSLELVGRRAPRAEPLASDVESVRLVVLSGASTAVLPALYGLMPFNDCPDPVTHAVVLGRWARELDARVRLLSDDAMTLDVATPPDDAGAIAWSALAAEAYCPGSVILMEYARLVRSSRWHFWWD